MVSVKLTAMFVHGPEVRRLSTRMTSSESKYESSLQLMVVLAICLNSGKVSKPCASSLASSIVMIGKSGAESYLTFGSENLIEQTGRGKEGLLKKLRPGVHRDHVSQADRACSRLHLGTTCRIPSPASPVCPGAHPPLPTHEVLRLEGPECGRPGQSRDRGADHPLPVGRPGQGGEQAASALHANLPSRPPLNLYGAGALAGAGERERTHLEADGRSFRKSSHPCSGQPGCWLALNGGFNICLVEIFKICHKVKFGTLTIESKRF